jgi:succinate dehydrogenase/fumarate reductase cytochrome b subunit
VVALATVAAPALYSWLGGLLDFQHAIPVSADTVWYPLYAGLAVLGTMDTAGPATRRPRPARLAFLHGCSGAVVAAFALAHSATHLSAVAGGAVHMAVMAALRTIYRAPAVEILLLASVALQAMTGLRLLRAHSGRDGSWWDTAQLASGVYLTAFFASHLTAALRARWLRGVDTNWVWLTADSMLTDPWSARLAPYYALSVIALGVHAGMGLRFILTARGWSSRAADGTALVMASAATAASALIMFALLRG